MEEIEGHWYLKEQTMKVSYSFDGIVRIRTSREARTRICYLFKRFSKPANAKNCNATLYFQNIQTNESVWRFFWLVLAPYWFVLARSGTFWYVLVHSGNSFWVVLAHSGSFSALQLPPKMRCRVHAVLL